MLLRHATLARNLNNILRNGLLAAKSRGKLRAVWAVGCHLTHWAIAHVVLRHGGGSNQPLCSRSTSPVLGFANTAARPGACGTASGTFPRPGSSA
jgi:hypothetical protein